MRVQLTGRLGVAAMTIIGLGALAACSSAGVTPAASGGNSTPTTVATPWPSVIALPTELPEQITWDQLLPLFAYDGAGPLDLAIVSSETDDGARIEDITFTGAAGETIEAFLILPEGSGPFPAVLFEHGAGGDRYGFLYDATQLAQQQHIVGLAVSRPTGLDNDTNDRIEMILQVREMRRALDLLASLPQVDKSRLGYVGFSQGAVYGMSLCAAETRLKTAVLAAAVPGMWDIELTAPHVTVPSVLLQFGTQDGYYTHETAEALAALIPATKQVTWYEAPHNLNSAATADRATWLAQKLGAG